MSNQTTQLEVAIITGAARGIGREIASVLARDGVAVGIVDLNEGDCIRAVAEIEAEGGWAVALPADVTSATAVMDAIDSMEAHTGALTIVVNNAAIATMTPLDDVDERAFRSTFEVNLIAPFVVAREAARRMAARGYGRIVNMASQSATIASSNQGVYSASKAALESLTRTMAFEWGPHGITANAIAPGSILTPLQLETIPAEGRAARIERIPVGRLGEPSDIAAAVRYLVSREASFVNGAVLRVDGGYVMAGIRDAQMS